MIEGFKNSGIVSCAASFIPALAFDATHRALNRFVERRRSRQCAPRIHLVHVVLQTLGKLSVQADVYIAALAYRDGAANHANGIRH